MLSDVDAKRAVPANAKWVMQACVNEHEVEGMPKKNTNAPATWSV